MKSSRSNLKQFVGKSFTGRVVLLDGREFIHCKFTRCLLRYRGGPVKFGPGTCAEDCQPEFIGSAKRTIEMLDIFGLLKFKPMREP
jgi:hypothetical protein